MPSTLKMIYALATINAVLGLFIFFVCFCRVVVSSGKVLGRVRLKFILLGPAAMAFGFSPWWGNLPGYTESLLLGAIVIGLLSETYQWKHGPPPSVREDTMPGELYTDYARSWVKRVGAKLKALFQAVFKRDDK